MRIAGEEAVGIYMTSYPAFVFFISVLQLGIPIAVAKIVAELHAKRRDGQLKSVMQTATRWSILSIIIFTPLLYYFIPYLAGTLLHNEATKFTLYIALGAVPIVVFSGLFRGYLQGIAVISATAWSQMLEQVIRIVLITFLLPFFATPDNPAATAGYAMAITAIGELFSFIYLYIHYNIKKKGLDNQTLKKLIQQCLYCV